jgi:signal transduction histidine kinase
MAPTDGSPLLAGVRAAPGYPFRGPGLLARVAPFAAVVVLAEASLALPAGGRMSPWAAVASIVLLLAMPGAFLLPWPRLPAWMPVLVPLIGTGWVLALLLADGGAHVGLAPIVLVPVLWTALFHRRWESACVVAAIAVVEVVGSLVPAAATASVIVRRVLLWILLSGLISVAVHGLRDRIRRSQQETAALEERLRELALLEDRDRIAADLQDKVVHRIFAAGLTLHSAGALAAEPEVSRRIRESVRELDEALETLRDTIFGLGPRTGHAGLREKVLELSGQLTPPPEVTFTGPVDGALLPAVSTRMLELVRDGLDPITRQFRPVRIGVTADGTSYAMVVEAVPRSRAGEADGAGEVNGMAPGFSRLRERAARAGVRMRIEPGPDGTRFAWHVPLDSSVPDE